MSITPKNDNSLFPLFLCVQLDAKTYWLEVLCPVIPYNSQLPLVRRQPADRLPLRVIIIEGIDGVYQMCKTVGNKKKNKEGAADVYCTYLLSVVYRITHIVCLCLIAKQKTGSPFCKFVVLHYYSLFYGFNINISDIINFVCVISCRQSSSS